MPVFYAYQKQAGLSDGQIFGIQSIYYVAFCLFEIPTGIIADRFGYRNCLRAGAVVLTAANLAPVFRLLHRLPPPLPRHRPGPLPDLGRRSAYLYDGHARRECRRAYPQAEGTAVPTASRQGRLLAAGRPLDAVRTRLRTAQRRQRRARWPRRGAPRLPAGQPIATRPRRGGARRRPPFLRDAGAALRAWPPRGGWPW